MSGTCYSLNKYLLNTWMSKSVNQLITLRGYNKEGGSAGTCTFIKSKNQNLFKTYLCYFFSLVFCNALDVMLFILRNGVVRKK